MTQELVTIEFRYRDKPTGDYDGGYRSKTITIGVYNTFDEAALEGNKILEILESKYPLNPHWNKKDRFSKNGGCFGYPKRLITNLAYLTTPFEFYAKIETLTYDNVEQVISNVVESIDRYKEYKSLNQD